MTPAAEDRNIFQKRVRIFYTFRPTHSFPPMQIDKTLENGKLSLSLAGRLDTTTAPDLEAEMVLDGVSEIAFDLSRLEYISSAGLRILLSAQKAMAAAGGTMTVANPNATVAGVFAITGLDSIFTVVRTDALP